MTDLDDTAAILAADRGGMLEAIAHLPEHCADGYANGLGTKGLPSANGVTAIAFCGMGGSAVAGDVIRALYISRLRVPFEVIRTPALPEFCGPHTLVFASSYSGDTAETLTCFEEAVRRGCRVVPVSSGGELVARAAELDLAVVPVPAGYQPRAALGFLALGALGALEAMGVVPSADEDLGEATDVLRTLAATLTPDVPVASNRAKQLAAAIGTRTPVVWGAEGLGSVAAMRWKTQMNENGKIPAWWASMSELDHNEIVGWSGETGKGSYLIALRHEEERRDLADRFPLTLEIVADAGLRGEEVWAHGRSNIARLLSLILIGDLASVYVGIGRGFDPTPVDVITRLKTALAGE